MRHSYQITTPIVMWFAATLFVTCGIMPQVDSAEESKTFSNGALIRIEGPLTPRLEQYLHRKLDDAKDSGADLVVIEIESPGGYLTTSQQMAEYLRDNVTWARTVAFVPKQALSGAAILALGCDEILLAPTALIGDAGAIYQDEYGMFQYVEAKIVSDFAEWVRVMAESNGHSPALAEAMVDRNKVVYHAVNPQSGESKIVSEVEARKLRKEPGWQVEQVRESEEGRFLELNGNRAVELGLAADLASSRNDVRHRFGLPDDFTVYEETWVDKVVYVLNWPLVTGLLLVIGMVAIYIELSAPGISIGGLIGGLCFALFFWSRFFGGTSGWLEVILFVAAIVFIAVEVFVIPGWGIAGITGLLLLVVSVVMAGQSFLIPTTSREYSVVGNSLLVVLGSGASFIVVAMVLSRHLGSLPVFNKLVLKPPTAAESKSEIVASESDKSPAPRVTDGITVGDWGTAYSPLRPSGLATFGEEMVDVVADGSFVDKGQQIRVIEVRGNRVVVREVDA
jgi:membrane-bound serine protease (ClpP class)